MDVISKEEFLESTSNAGPISAIQDKDSRMRLTFPEKLMDMLHEKSFHAAYNGSLMKNYLKS